MTHISRYLTARGIKPILEFKHNFQNTYLYGFYSPIYGDAFVYELEHRTAKLSQHGAEQFKIVVIDNTAFHSLKNIKVPENIFLINSLPYIPELNPCEKVWAYIKQKFKN